MRNNEHKPKKERDARVKERRRTITGERRVSEVALGRRPRNATVSTEQKTTEQTKRW
jgi:hypothetical protein